MLDRYVFGEITNGGFPPALQDRIVAAVLKFNAHPLDPAARREAEAVGRDMLRHQGEHAAFGMLKRVHSQPGGIDLAALAKGSEAAPLSSGLASEPDRESVRLVAPDWIAPGSQWELPANAPTVEGGVRLVAVVGADRTAVVPASFAIALLSSWASAGAEPGDPGGGYRHRDSIRAADLAAAAASMCRTTAAAAGASHPSTTTAPAPGRPARRTGGALATRTAKITDDGIRRPWRIAGRRRTGAPAVSQARARAPGRLFRWLAS